MKYRMRVIAPASSKRNAPLARGVFAYSFGNDCWRWGAVACEYPWFGPGVDGYLVHFYDVVSRAGDAVPDLGACGLVIPPCITNEMPWKRGLFRNEPSVVPRDGRSMPQHCLWSPEDNLYRDEHDTVLESAFEPCGLRMLAGIQAIEELLLSASLMGCWDGRGTWRLWPPRDWRGVSRAR